jgi:hypothetical protein
VAMVRLILREILILAGVAIAVTIPISIFVTRALRSQLFNVSSTDASVYAPRSRSSSSSLPSRG